MSIALVWLAIFFSLTVTFRVDIDLVKKRIPSLGLITSFMFSLTYGIGWTLWRIDPNSLLGYGTASTLGSLDRLALLLSLGLPILVSTYSLTRLSFRLTSNRTFLDLAERNRPMLESLCLALLVICVVGLFGMTSTGMFLRDPLQQQQALQSSWVAKLLIGTGLLSRLAPVCLVILPLAWTGWVRWQRSLAVVLISIWAVLVIGSSSRGQLLALPLYLFLGSIIWSRLSLKRAALLLLTGALLFLPFAEVIRVNREGDQANPALTRKFEIFQIGKQIMGTTHEFYLFLQPHDCSSDLALQLERDPQAYRLLGIPASELPDTSAERWNVVRLYQNCSLRQVSKRSFSGFNRLPHGLIPNTIFPTSPSLFDGQNLVQRLSDDLGLRPGEISQGTLSIFADAWWRWRWAGVICVSSVLGIFFGLIQTVLIWTMKSFPVAGLLGQLLALSLFGTWLNNTTLTMFWILLWDLPKAWLELMVLASFIGYRTHRLHL